MRILEINKFYYERRGAERHFLDVISLFRDAGHEVAVFTMDDSRNVSDEYGAYAVSSVGYNADDSTRWERFIGAGRLFWSFEARRKLRALLDEFRPDVVHVHNAYHQLSLSFLPIIRKRKIPIIMTVHDYHLVSPDKDTYYPFVGGKYWRFLLIRKYSFPKRLLLVLKSYWERLRGYKWMVDVYIAPSEYVKNILVQAGLRAGRIVVLPHFVLPERTEDIPVVTDHEPYALYLGAVSEEKNVDELISIFEWLKYPLLLVGKKDMDIKESEYVRYVGEKTKRDLESLILGSRFVVSASRLPETFGLVTLEANVLGRPFLGYATGAFPEIIENGTNGWLAPDEESFHDMIAAFIAGERTIFSAETIREKTLLRFGPERYLGRFIPIAERLLNRKRP